MSTEENNLNTQEEDEEQVVDFEEEEEELIISYSNDEDNYYSHYFKEINICRALYLEFYFPETTGNTISFRIPTSILPLTVQLVNGFDNNPYLADCAFELNQNNPWRTLPHPYQITNSTYGQSFPGSILIQNRINRFFSPDFKPQHRYRCQSYVLAPQTSTKPNNLQELVSKLTSESFSDKQSLKALQFCSYDLDKARDYLITGMLEPTHYELPQGYLDCPLFYLVLEICEAFFDMCDCCCICGKELGVYCLKPSCCNDEVCQHAFLNHGVGANIVGEIKRDPLAADFLISLASIAFYAPKEPPVFEPSPETQGLEIPDNFFSEFPSMKSICELCQTDSDLIDMIGKNKFDLLRFFILSNKAQFITLPKKLQVYGDKFDGFQFLVTFVSPESELKFLEKKKRFGAQWLWHGSSTTRWYRILHTGLKDCFKTKYQLHGGIGIYMSDSFNYSYSYCGLPLENRYKNSHFYSFFNVISLNETAKGPGLNRLPGPREFTQSDESASITRVLFLKEYIDGKYDYQYYLAGDFNTLENPPKVPSLTDLIANKYLDI